MRIAWIGPMPNNDGGATGVGRQILQEISRQGVEVDCFFPGKESALPEVLVGERNLRIYCQPSSWQWNRWYSRNNFLAFITGQIANLCCELKLAKSLVNQHKIKPYDLVYQFSHIELHALKRYKKQLPPIVLHPSVHAAGELKWHRKEAYLSRLSEPFFKRLLVRLLLMARAFVQKRHVRKVDYVLSLSHNFAEEVSSDYHLQPSKAAYIVPNSIDIERYSPKPGVAKYGADHRITFLFVSRIAVRKGVEMMVELSHRLSDISNNVRILIVGNHSLWSDYRGLLSQLNTDVATYVGQLSGGEMDNLYNSVDALIQPSHYEPFGLTVGEALACGLPVIASDKVGAAEKVNRICCRVFPAGDIEALECSVRSLLEDLCSPNRTEITELARSEAIRLFSNEVIVSELVSILNEIIDARKNSKQPEKTISKPNMAVN
ncbi:glycosyltransferase family 4 protein [Cohnella luojiensis]|uniref:Glycosyltransferase family 1 protein n=1 Tax=Cohnella luojiensis TaxID=652876 RepID=A0A4Y8LUN4_9BACL|nr:glycosyltransferase family 4 protein [Cohnella luojiensis]TFE22641.1 glycosyltransferase family 1 protein [Cohnella luojiensis]